MWLQNGILLKLLNCEKSDLTISTLYFSLFFQTLKIENTEAIFFSKSYIPGHIWFKIAINIFKQIWTIGFKLMSFWSQSLIK